MACQMLPAILPFGPGGERGIDVGRACGYKTGSGVSQAIKRLEQTAASDASLRQRRDTLKKEMSNVQSYPVLLWQNGGLASPVVKLKGLDRNQTYLVTLN
jgi:hypothetical protein